MSRRILVPIDAAPQSETALEHAADVYPEATIVLLHVLDPRSWISSDEFGDMLYADDVEKAEQEATEELLEKMTELADELDVTTETVKLMGRPAHTIVEYAGDSENDIDGIVMGSHGRTGLDRIFLGSVAESVTRRSPVPVTIVH
ncbi:MULTISPECIES: universal stress protein [unclassified Haladaptatus]|uniref:universal stress protein n=1 Tax=unclassified Haladaptatus TaxID=2622732 RepID=UPI00209C2058|nr:MULTISPECIES: universal stress protein [unclassified Haladaptatus]MCO8243320.1 universal stress protein [Haladaptatus sp. AB643]MCO8253031.1 universal stress protein [Haladaptatus sp. AB618]